MTCIVAAAASFRSDGEWVLSPDGHFFNVLEELGFFSCVDKFEVTSWVGFVFRNA